MFPDLVFPGQGFYFFTEAKFTPSLSRARRTISETDMPRFLASLLMRSSSSLLALTLRKRGRCLGVIALVWTGVPTLAPLGTPAEPLTVAKGSRPILSIA